MTVKLALRGLRGEGFADLARRVGTLGISDDATDAEVLNAFTAAAAGHAESASDAAELAQAALAGLGVGEFRNTKALADADAAGWADGTVALIWADETRGGARTYYVKEDGLLTFKALGAPLMKIDPQAGVMLLGSTGASLTPGATAGDHDGDSIVVVSPDFSGAATTSYAIGGVGPGVLVYLTTGHSLWAGGYQALHRATTASAVTATGTDCGFNVTTAQRLSLYGRHIMFKGDGTVDFTGADGVIIGESIAREAVDWYDFCIGGQNTMLTSPGSGSYQFTAWGTKAVLGASLVQSNVRGNEVALQAVSLLQSDLGGFRNCGNVEVINYTVSEGAYGFYNDTLLAGRTLNGCVGMGESHGYNMSGARLFTHGNRALAQTAPTVGNDRMALGYRAGDAAGGASALADGDYVIAMGPEDSRRILWGSCFNRTHNVGGTLAVDGWVKPKSYTVATVPSAATAGAGATIYVSNDAAGPVLAFSDGTSWLRCTDRTAIAA